MKLKYFFTIFLLYNCAYQNSKNMQYKRENKKKIIHFNSKEEVLEKNKLLINGYVNNFIKEADVIIPNDIIKLIDNYIEKYFITDINQNEGIVLGENNEIYLNTNCNLKDFAFIKTHSDYLKDIDYISNYFFYFKLLDNKDIIAIQPFSNNLILYNKIDKKIIKEIDTDYSNKLKDDHINFYDKQLILLKQNKIVIVSFSSQINDIIIPSFNADFATLISDNILLIKIGNLRESGMYFFMINTSKSSKMIYKGEIEDIIVFNYKIFFRSNSKLKCLILNNINNISDFKELDYSILELSNYIEIFNIDKENETIAILKKCNTLELYDLKRNKIFKEFIVNTMFIENIAISGKEIFLVPHAYVSYY